MLCLIRYLFVISADDCIRLENDLSSSRIQWNVKFYRLSNKPLSRQSYISHIVYRMASEINIYSQLLISRIRIVDINNSNC